MTHSMNRRDLLRMGSAGMMAGGVSAFLPGRSAFGQISGGGGATPLPTKMVVLFLRGGNDGVNTVIPWGDPDYQNSAWRSTLTIPDTESLDIGNSFARVNPGLEAIVNGPHASGDVRFLQQVGHSAGSRSHFVEQQNYETTKLFDANFTHGWITRLAEHLGFHLIGTPSYNPVGAVSNSLTLQMSMSGLPALNHIPSLADFTRDPNGNPQYPILFDRLREAYDRPPTTAHEWDELVRDTGKIMSDALGIIEPLGPYTPMVDWTGSGVDHSFPLTSAQFADPNVNLAYSTNAVGLMANFKDITQLLRDTSARICATQYGSFDTHANQKGAHEDQWRIVSHAIRSLYEELKTVPGLWRRTIVLVVSEFGRTGNQNGSNGTDHGSGGVALALGGLVRGGVSQCNDLSEWPQGTMVALGTGQARYQPVVTDFRDVYAEIVHKFFRQGANLDDIIYDYSNQAPGIYDGILP